MAARPQSSSVVLARDERGQTLVEYALVVAMISIAAVAALQLMTGQIVQVFNTLSTAL